jgi:pentatricopeptide repeat protein
VRLGRYEEANVYWDAMERSLGKGSRGKAEAGTDSGEGGMDSRSSSGKGVGSSVSSGIAAIPVLEFNKLFDILGRAKQWPRLRAAYDRMLRGGVRPNKATYQVLAHSAAVAAPWPEVCWM